MSIFLWQLTSGYRRWSYCEHLGDAVHDPIGTHLIGEDGIHGPSAKRITRKVSSMIEVTPFLVA